MTQLTPAQEENSITEIAFLELITGEKSPKNPFAKAVWDTLKINGYKISRLYHTEASKTGVSGEVKTAEEIAAKHASPYGIFDEEHALAAMREYAAQFEAKWQTMESAPKETPIQLLLTKDRQTVGCFTTVDFVGTGWFTILPVSHGTGLGTDTFMRFPEEQPIRWMPLIDSPLPSPPTPQQ